MSHTELHTLAAILEPPVSRSQFGQGRRYLAR